MSRSWYVEHNGKPVGPATSSQLKKLAQAGKINRDTRVRIGEDGKWVRAEKVQGLFAATEVSRPKQELVAQSPPPAPVSATIQTVAVSEPNVQRRPCPFCGEDIAMSAIKCRHCGEFLDGRPCQTAPAPVPQAAVNVTQVVNNVAPYGGARKSKGIAVLLALLLGGLGVHHFYMGRTIRGLLYLLFCWTFIPAILALLEAVYYACMSERNFQSRCR